MTEDELNDWTQHIADVRAGKTYSKVDLAVLEKFIAEVRRLRFECKYWQDLQFPHDEAD